MKAAREEPKPCFVPVCVTLETQAEVDAVYALLNCGRFSEVLGLKWMVDSLNALRPFRTLEADRLHKQLNELIKDN
jgi:hypothetical protein